MCILVIHVVVRSLPVYASPTPHTSNSVQHHDVGFGVVDDVLGHRLCQQSSTDNACHVILNIVDHRFLSQMEQHDVSRIICQTQPTSASCHQLVEW
jgi:hypothetical protein